MNIQELYQSIDGDYDQAIRVLRVDKLVDKHIRRFVDNDVVDGLLTAGGSMNPTDLFEAAHAVKGVTANLGLSKLSDMASEITEEYRPGNERKLSDEDVKLKIEAIRELHEQIVDKIQKYIELSE
jgi:HPt (histidine-containing phosphotransfer) domain-containing protein